MKSKIMFCIPGRVLVNLSDHLVYKKVSEYHVGMHNGFYILLSDVNQNSSFLTHNMTTLTE